MSRVCWLCKEIGIYGSSYSVRSLSHHLLLIRRPLCRLRFVDVFFSTQISIEINQNNVQMQILFQDDNSLKT